MRKIIFPAIAISFIALIFLVNEIKELAFKRHIEAVNARIEFLHIEQGYTIEAAKHIADVEFRLVPADKEYYSLIED